MLSLEPVSSTVRALCLLCIGLSSLAARAQQPAAAPVAPAAGAGPSRIERGLQELPLLVPRAEELEYNVHIELAMLSTDIGKVWLRTGTRPFHDAVLFEDEEPGSVRTQEIAWIQARAKGGNALYQTDSRIESMHLPQSWPAVRLTFDQTGSELRRHELLFGFRDGKHMASYRRDTDKGAPRGTRIWKQPEERRLPAGTLDMLSAGYFSRHLFTGAADKLNFPMIDKLKLWDVELERGPTVELQLPCGRFRANELVMRTKPAPSDVPRKQVQEPEAFEGPFGIHGQIGIYLEANSGVPVRFRGTIPLGPFELRADIDLIRYEGTPASFAALPPAPTDPSTPSER